MNDYSRFKVGDEVICIENDVMEEWVNDTGIVTSEGTRSIEVKWSTEKRKQRTTQSRIRHVTKLDKVLR